MKIDLNESEDIKMDILEIMKERHSVRQYKNQAIEPSKRGVKMVK